MAKPFSAATQLLWNSRQWYQADLFIFSGGNLSTPLRYCSGDTDLTYNGVKFLCGGASGPYFDRQDNKAKFSQKLGLEVDTLTIDIIPGDGKVYNVPMIKAFHDGLFDGCAFAMWRCYMATYGDLTYGVVPIFHGRVADIEISRTIIVLTINSTIELLNQNLPRNLFQASCVNSLGDDACGVNLANYTANFTVGSGSTTYHVILSTSLGVTAKWDLGKLVCLSGPNNGISRTIANAGNNVVNLVGVLPNVPAPGDLIALSLGCDKSAGANGCVKFSNTPRFRATPFIPQPSTAV
jgi:uncharacterized phage protein (TIGR02218 family)